MFFGRTLFMTVAIWSLLAGISSANEVRPNIVVILADDLGYADLGCQGCKDIPTPHIDSIAENGVRLTDGYATHPVCAPSRAGLMSGMYQHRLGFERNGDDLPRNIPTLAETLKTSGYATGMVGKWHLGSGEGLRPHERGFEYYYGFVGGARSYYPDSPERNDPIVRNGVPVTDEQDYLTDAFGRESADFIELNQEGPFFLYLSFNAVHNPLEATSHYEKRFPDITDPKRKTYAGMLAAMDDAVGRVLVKLREHKLEGSTLVFFYSDNGGPTKETTSRNDPLRGGKAQMFEGGIRIPFLIQWKEKLPAGKVYTKPVMAFDIYATALAAAGIPAPTDKPLDGVDLLPFLLGDKSGVPHESLFWRGSRQNAARVGDWKLVSPPGTRSSDMLFNLADDIGEQKDLAAKQPEKLKVLQAAYEVWDKHMMPAQSR